MSPIIKQVVTDILILVRIIVTVVILCEECPFIVVVHRILGAASGESVHVTSGALRISFRRAFNFFELVGRLGNPSGNFGESSRHIPPPIIIERDSCTRPFAGADVDGFWEVGAFRIGCVNGLNRNYAVFHKREGSHYLE